MTHQQQTKNAVLVLEDGSRFEGFEYGATGETLGELVFTTGMTGYQETLTDPSYAGQIVMMTAPHIGNTGANDTDMESTRIWAAGLVVRDAARRVSNFRAQRSLDENLEADTVVGIRGVDTRAITRHIRSRGAMKAGIFSGEHFSLDASEQHNRVSSQESMAGRNLSLVVTTPKPYSIPAVGERVGRIVVLDLGVKRATLGYLAEHGFEVEVLPANSSFDDVTALKPDAVFYSNGPGDPSASEAQVQLLRQILDARIPYFGICFGNQLLGRALGLETYKLPFGHRGINQPVLDKASGRVEITSQNHGFAVDAPIDASFESPLGYGKVEVSHYSLNDQVVEGLRCHNIPAFSVQYHPEAAAGPHDAQYLFARLRELVQSSASTEKDTK